MGSRPTKAVLFVVALYGGPLALVTLVLLLLLFWGQSTPQGGQAGSRTFTATRVPVPGSGSATTPSRVLTRTTQSTDRNRTSRTSRQRRPRYLLVAEDDADRKPPVTKAKDTNSVYVDKLIPGIKGNGNGVIDDADSRRGRQYSPGRLGIEYRYFDSKTTNSVSSSILEHGVGISLSQQTRHLGTLDLDVASTNQEQSPMPDIGSGQIIKFRQRDFAINDNWVMDNRAGHLRAFTPGMISTSFRYRLPAPIIEGISVQASSANTSINLTTGDLGRLRGRTFPVFDNAGRSGNITGIGVIHRLGKKWSAGLQFWDVNDALFGTTLSTHTSTAGVIQYSNAKKQQKGQFHILRNDTGNQGVWVDGESGTRRWQHNYGLYRFDPNLKWLDDTTGIATDRNGFYLLSRFGRHRFRLGLGTEYYETNLDNNPIITGKKTTNSFVSVAHQISRTTNVNGSVNYLSQQGGSGLPSADEDTLGLRTSISHRFDIGTSYWSASLSDRDSPTDPSSRTEVIWDHEWNVRSNDQFRTGISYERDERGNETFDQTSFRLNARRDLDHGRIGLNGGLSYAIGGGGITDEGRSSNTTFGISWRFNRKLSMGSTLNWNKNVVRLTNGVETTINERSISFNLRYDLSWGTAKAFKGRATGRIGSGSIKGVIYRDSNRNGIQEPSEPGIPNVIVYLDGGYSVETNSKGEFEFWPVPAGGHRISISQDNIPLPWGLADEKPRAITVRTRKQTDVSYPLVNLNE